jgi:hypothetical protein
MMVVAMKMVTSIKVIRHKKEALVTGADRNLHNGKLHNLCCGDQMKEDEMGWVYIMYGEMNVYDTLVIEH